MLLRIPQASPHITQSSPDFLDHPFTISPIIIIRCPQLSYYFLNCQDMVNPITIFLFPLSFYDFFSPLPTYSTLFYFLDHPSYDFLTIYSIVLRCSQPSSDMMILLRFQHPSYDFLSPRTIISILFGFLSPFDFLSPFTIF